MRNLQEILGNGRLLVQEYKPNDGGYAYAFLPGSNKPIVVIFSWGEGWEHVSVSYKNRCCTWEEMCFIKDIFWSDEECVVQFHPPKSEYVNRHPYCLHLWKPKDFDIPTPPKHLVG